MSPNIDYVQDENANVNIKYYCIDPSSYIGKLAFPTSLSSRLSTTCLEQNPSNSDNRRDFSNNELNTAANLGLGNEAKNSNDKSCEESDESCCKDTSQEELGGDQDMMSPKSKSPAIEDLEDVKTTNSHDRAEEILIVEQQVNEEVDHNQNFPRTEENEMDAIENELKGEGSPRVSNITNPVLHANDKPFLHEDSDRKKLQTLTENKVDIQSHDISTPGPTKKVPSCTKYSEEFRIKVVLYSKTHTHSETSKKFGVPRGTVSYWCSLYSLVTNIAIGILDEIIDSALKSKLDKTTNSNKYPHYSTEFRRRVLDYAQAHTPTQAAKKYSVSKSSIRRWKEKQSVQSSDVKPRKASGSESFEDLYSDEDSLGAKKRKRRKMSTDDSSDDSDDANSLGVCKRRNERESTPMSVDGNKSPRPPKDPHQLRLAVLDYARKHSFEEASEVFKVDVETISGWLY